jgi:hypothetical protein
MNRENQGVLSGLSSVAFHAAHASGIDAVFERLYMPCQINASSERLKTMYSAIGPERRASFAEVIIFAYPLQKPQ